MRCRSGRDVGGVETASSSGAERNAASKKEASVPLLPGLGSGASVALGICPCALLITRRQGHGLGAGLSALARPSGSKE